MNSLNSPGVSTPWHGSDDGDSVLVTGSAIYKPAGCRRYIGNALPPGGTPTPASSLENLNERLERLAFGGRPQGHNAPPLEAYTTTPAANGDVVRATQAYREWFLRAYPASGPEDCVSQPAPGPSSEGVGGTKGRWKQNDIAP